MNDECLGREGFYSRCKIEGDDEYYGRWVSCECGYCDNLLTAKYCGGCGRLIQIVSEDRKNSDRFG